MKRDDRFRPRSFVDDPGPDPVSLINEPLAPANVTTIVRTGKRPLHLVLIESLNHTKSLVAHLERGVGVSRDQQRQTVRELYVAARGFVRALSATLELEGLE